MQDIKKEMKIGAGKKDGSFESKEVECSEMKG